MANDEHISILKRGVDAWNAWRAANSDILPDLTKADLSRWDLSNELKLRDPVGAGLLKADLSEANLSRANLTGAVLNGANLERANLTGADLSRADVRSATLVDTDLTGADLTGCRVYGVSAWRLKLDGAKQQNLVITDADEPAITVDNIEVAQFIYLMLNTRKFVM
jgi:uncharacterized protein YjbI with pentapeptide repeats